MALELRRVERLVDGEFKQSSFAELKAKDKFKLFDDGENPIEDGSQVYIALTDAMPCDPEGNYGVKIGDQVLVAPDLSAEETATFRAAIDKCTENPNYTIDIGIDTKGN